jgi:hypothetical protein
MDDMQMILFSAPENCRVISLYTQSTRSPTAAAILLIEKDTQARFMYISFSFLTFGYDYDQRRAMPITIQFFLHKGVQQQRLF